VAEQIHKAGFDFFIDVKGDGDGFLEQWLWDLSPTWQCKRTQKPSWSLLQCNFA